MSRGNQTTTRGTPRAGDQATGRRSWGLGRWAGLAALAHLWLLLGAYTFSYFFAPRDADLVQADIESVEIGVVGNDLAEGLLEELAEIEREAEEARREKEENATKAPGQVVQLAQPRVETRPDQADYAAEFNSKVNKQTKKYGDPDKPEVVSTRDGQGQADSAAQAPSAGRPQVAGGTQLGVPERAPQDPSKSLARDRPKKKTAAKGKKRRRRRTDATDDTKLAKRSAKEDADGKATDSGSQDRGGVESKLGVSKKVAGLRERTTRPPVKAQAKA